MEALQEQFDDAMFDFSTGAYDVAISKLQAILAADPQHFDAQLALGMAYYRKGDYQAAITAGHKAERLRPREQLVHTNLSLFYMKAGDRATAEHHGLQARIASWRQDPAAPQAKPDEDSALQMAKPQLESVKLQQTKFPDMPWKKKPPADSGSPGATGAATT
jgi:tetratricopeptide (TPR) repeat protein